MVPLLVFTGNRQKMGEFVNPLWLSLLAWAGALLIILLNGIVLRQSLAR